MEGPTPVSALIHAATMVTAGVFLIIRCSPLFEFAPTALTFITLVGAFTAFFGATVGLVQNDVKKVIAYSTSSQLGYMIFACGLSNYSSSFYHLINHGYFKAALFLASGALIHGFKNAQDMREMGNLAQKLPYTFFIMSIGSLALAGLPFLSGSFSKDLILEVAYLQATFLSRFAFILGILAAFCTAAYSTRLIFLVFICQSKYNEEVLPTFHKEDKTTNKLKSLNFKNNTLVRTQRLTRHDADNIIIIPLTVLAFGSIFSGSFLQQIFTLKSLNFFKHSIFMLNKNFQPTLCEFLPPIIK